MYLLHTIYLNSIEQCIVFFINGLNILIENKIYKRIHSMYLFRYSQKNLLESYYELKKKTELNKTVSVSKKR